MDLDYLDRYIWEAEAHANKLLELYDQETREALALWLDQNWEGVLPLLVDPPKRAFVFLGEDPATQLRRLATMREEDRRLLWVQARFLALRAATALRQAATVAAVKGMKYRLAVRHAAQAVSRVPDLPTAEVIALLRLPW